ncbi:hypothetical protein POM88_023632 [Heracleum sosnowskyi]|uniref:Uncharacterized protein n=1 Tax=Heracleum sosnowskyi TaxID=360622 RepID=A0AAD8IHE1_9APIA|nr:hypothetical protein POM88_023632 [Heracleum sosnowskyi]
MIFVVLLIEIASAVFVGSDHIQQLRYLCLQRSCLRKRRELRLWWQRGINAKWFFDVEVGLKKLAAEKEACTAFEATNVCYNASKEEFETMIIHLLQLVELDVFS